MLWWGGIKEKLKPNYYKIIEMSTRANEPCFVSDWSYLQEKKTTPETIASTLSDIHVFFLSIATTSCVIP